MRIPCFAAETEEALAEEHSSREPGHALAEVQKEMHSRHSGFDVKAAAQKGAHTGQEAAQQEERSRRDSPVCLGEEDQEEAHTRRFWLAVLAVALEAEHNAAVNSSCRRRSAGGAADAVSVAANFSGRVWAPDRQTLRSYCQSTFEWQSRGSLKIYKY